MELQLPAVCCSELQRVAVAVACQMDLIDKACVSCSDLQQVAVSCSVLQYVAVP